ncbi:hypothetical protein ONE63_007249 [Megalurothrips usitatus]|uniref:G-protein coupled receptors family 1 profile domain-containing protein n=1 Tax=Megalurothrips usitatus TaxID=439358 RepID=A0AAV7XUR3_9NEOP|nr:hypothetical protein ONE63_007249 [Megalurothrips usitatus]
MMENYVFPTKYEWMLIVLHAAVFCVGLIGNALVCAAVYRNPGMRTVTNYFLVNLAVADFLVILLCLPPTVVWDVTETWFMGTALCKIVLYFQVRTADCRGAGAICSHNATSPCDQSIHFPGRTSSANPSVNPSATPTTTLRRPYAPPPSPRHPQGNLHGHLHDQPHSCLPFPRPPPPHFQATSWLSFC